QCQTGFDAIVDSDIWNNRKYDQLVSGFVVPASGTVQPDVTIANPSNQYELHFRVESVPLTASEVNAAPVAVLSSPASVDEGSSVQLGAGGSVDSDGSIQAYEWDFDYDGVTFEVDATGASPEFPASNLDGPSSRTVALRVRDDLGTYSSVVTKR